MVVHTFNPTRGRSRWISEFKSSLVYRVSSRTARDTQRNYLSRQTKTEKERERERERDREREREGLFWLGI